MAKRAEMFGFGDTSDAKMNEGHGPCPARRGTLL